MARREQDRSLHVQFMRRGVYNEIKSEGKVFLDNDGKVVQTIEGAGRVVHDDVDYIRIICASDPTSIPERPVTACDRKLLETDSPSARCIATKPEDCDLHRFEDEWQNYKRGHAEQLSGTPVREWAGITPAQAEDLAHDKIYTVEALAGLHDSAAGRYLQLRQKARDFLAAADKMAQTTTMRAELSARDEQLADLRRQNEQFQAQLAALTAAQNAAQPKTPNRIKAP